MGSIISSKHHPAQQNDGLESKSTSMEENSVPLVQQQEEFDEEESVFQNSTRSEESAVIQEKSAPSAQTNFIQEEEKSVTEESVIENLIRLFQDIAVGETAHSATRFLRATNWNLEEALQLFFIGNQDPEPVIEKESSEGDNLYPPPIALIHPGCFEKVKLDAKAADKWLILNIQSSKEFNSQMLNGHTWANEALADTISCNFVFWQIDDDREEGQKVSNYYKVESRPVILVIDPITGLQMRSWIGMVEAETLLEDLMPFMDESPHHTPPSHFLRAIKQIHKLSH
ncbi:hypothetical protein LguiA_019499 [Lonicera macranthoides]